MCGAPGGGRAGAAEGSGDVGGRQASDGGKEFRFWSFERTGLKEGAPISLVWMGEKPVKEKGKAKFTYRLAE
jgi:hypothetical protein